MHFLGPGSPLITPEISPVIAKRSGRPPWLLYDRCAN